MNLLVRVVGLSSLQASLAQANLGPISAGPNSESNHDPFNLSPFIRQIIRSLSHIFRNR